MRGQPPPHCKLLSIDDTRKTCPGTRAHCLYCICSCMTMAFTAVPAIVPFQKHISFSLHDLWLQLKLISQVDCRQSSHTRAFTHQFPAIFSFHNFIFLHDLWLQLKLISQVQGVAKLPDMELLLSLCRAFARCVESRFGTVAAAQNYQNGALLSSLP